MPRIPRLVADGSCHHVLSRGNNKKRIFIFPEDYVYFLELVKETLKKHLINIYNYCPMPNHIHFLARAIQKEEFPKFFKILLQRYAQYFTKRYNHTGHLFENRYKSYLIEEDSYLLECARYIERNPVRSGIVAHPKDYQWSSFARYAYGKKDDIIVELNPAYLGLANNEEDRQRLYEEYVSQARPYELIIDKGLGIE